MSQNEKLIVKSDRNVTQSLYHPYVEATFAKKEIIYATQGFEPKSPGAEGLSRVCLPNGSSRHPNKRRIIMKKVNKLVALGIAVLLLVGSAVGCSQSTEMVDIHTPSYEEFADIVEFDPSLVMIPLAEAPAMFSGIPYPTAPGTNTKSNAKAVIDFTNAADGYVMIKYANAVTKKLKVRITGPTGTIYDYNLKQDATWEVFPLSDGNGSYTIGVFENTEGNKYSTTITHTLTVSLKDEFAPFLRPNQYVNFKADSQTVKKAGELVAGKTGLTDRVKAVYEFVVKTLTYDKDFAAQVSAGQHAGYVPNVDSVLSKGKGICFDYAALMAAMLRSQGIPTRLVIGYAGTAYHAWIDVFSESEGWINSFIFFDGKDWKLMDPTFASTGGDSGAANFVGDGSSYSAKYLY